MGWCSKCSNMGYLLDGTPCDCKIINTALFQDAVCVAIPEQYRGVIFNKMLVPTDMDESYRNYLAKMHADIITGKWQFKNVLLCSPAGHSKSILAYSAISTVFRNGQPVFPIYDVDELGMMLNGMDLGAKKILDTDNIESFLSVPVLFVRVPMVQTDKTFGTLARIIDIRVRRNGSTIFLYNGSFEQLTYNDSQFVLRSCLGDGSYCTLENRTFRRKS